MRRPLLVCAFGLVLGIGAWVWFAAAYAGDEESPPGWLLGIWFVAWGLLVLAILWAIVHLFRARIRAHKGGTVG